MKSRGGLGREVRIHNINFWSTRFWFIRKKIINVWSWNTSHDWQVKTTYSWCGLSGRKSLFKTNLTGVPSLTSPPPSLLFFRAPFYFAPLPTIWTPGTGYRTHGFCVSATVPYHLSYEGSGIGSWPICCNEFMEILTRERSETWRWCEARKYKF